MHLRPYQTDLIDRTRNCLRHGIRNPLIVAPTGSGKTALTAFMLGNASARGKVCWFVMHRQELVQQASDTFNLVGIEHSFIASGYPYNRNARVFLVSVQTVARRLGRLPAPDMLVWDECHHCAAKSWHTVMAAFPAAIHIGLSATPQRLDGKGLRDYFGVLVQGPTVAELIADGWLCDYKVYAPSVPSVTGVHTVAGDYQKDELAAIVDKPSITGDVVTHYQRLANGKRFLCRGVSIEHSQHIAAQFQAAGIPCAHVDGNTDRNVRAMAMREFRSGALMGLCNVDLFSEGVDVPAVEAIIDVRPTKSLTLAMQFWGRGLRPSEGKQHAVILDHAGNCFRHGLPDDVRNWALEGNAEKAKRGEDSGPRVRQCKTCFAANPVSADSCRECGEPFQAIPREVQRRDGTLTEIDRAAINRSKRREEGQAQSLEDFQRIATQRGYNQAWARIRWNLRQRRMA